MPSGVREPVIPDAYGLPQYRVTKIFRERVGDEIRFLCCIVLFGQVQAECVIFMEAADVLVESMESQMLASEAIRERALRGVSAAH